MIKPSPFSTSPNPANLYLTASLKETIFKIRYTIEERRGLTCLFGDLGLGKSSIARAVYGEYDENEMYKLCMIQTPNFSSGFGLLKGICAELGLPPKNSISNQETLLRDFLFKQLAENKTTVIFLDEGQRLTDEMLEVVRTLLNLETNTTKLLQICLIGQLELKERLLKIKLKAIKSRIFTYSILDPMSVSEIGAMINFRCERGGVDCPVPDNLYQQLYDLSGGIPRDVLKICDLSYALMYQYGETAFNSELIESAAEKVLLKE